MLSNSQGKVWYGLHFYPGVAEYHPPGKAAFRVFVNENTIRAMGPSFTARPVFLMHVDGVEQDLNELRKDADGWVVESFYNECDGKHWAKFITVTERAERAIGQGFKLSNAYEPKQFGQSGVWNGVTYDREVLAGEYEHLALVPDPRYAESVILNPEQFKVYNDEKRSELTRLANQDSKEGKGMKLNIFKRAKVENSTDLEGMMVELPKSKKEIALIQLINERDEHESKEEHMANGDHMVEYGGKKMSVNDLMKAHTALNDEISTLKARHYDDRHDNNGDGRPDDDLSTTSPIEMSSADKHKNDMEALELKHKNELEELNKKHGKEPSKDELEARRIAKEKADKVRNAADQNQNQVEAPKYDTIQDGVERGKSRYGS